MTAGRPLLFTDPDDLERKIQDYFDVCDAGEQVTELSKRGEIVNYVKPIPYTMEGLAVHLNCSGETIRNYGKTEKFFGTISRARDKIQASWIKNGLNGAFNPKVVSLILAASCKDYRITQEVNHVSSTVEGILQRLSGQQATPQIEHQGDDISDAEVVE